jgi:hypothetical protein
LANLLFTSGSGGVAVLLEQLDDPAVRPFAIGALRHSHDEAVWDRLLATAAAMRRDREAHLGLSGRLKLKVFKKCQYIRRDPSGTRGLFADHAHGYSLSLPAEWVVMVDTPMKNGGHVVQFASSPQTVKGLLEIEGLVKPLATVFSRTLDRAHRSIDAETFVAISLGERARLESMAPDAEENETQLEPELLEDRHRVVVDGRPAVAERWASGLRTTWSCRLVDRGRFYTLGTSTLLRDWETFRPTHDEIVGSFMLASGD